MFFFSKIKVRYYISRWLMCWDFYWFPAFDEGSMNIPFTAVYNSSYIAIWQISKKERDRKRKSNQLFPAQVIYVEELFFFWGGAAAYNIVCAGKMIMTVDLICCSSSVREKSPTKRWRWWNARTLVIRLRSSSNSRSSSENCSGVFLISKRHQLWWGGAADLPLRPVAGCW